MGTLKRDFKFMAGVELMHISDEIRARSWFTKSRRLSLLRTVCSDIRNMFDGVEKKFEYRMRLVYAHFPINATILNNGTTLELRNFLGEKMVRVIHVARREDRERPRGEGRVGAQGHRHRAHVAFRGTHPSVLPR